MRFSPDWVTVLVVGGSLGLTVVSSLRVAPHYLAYFNELCGGPDKGYRYLSDSNIDWGQDLKGLKEYMDREGLPMIYLSYFGTAPPEYYGIRYQYVPPAFLMDHPEPADLVPLVAERDVLAVSVFNLQGIRFADKTIFQWLLDRAPIAKIGYSIYIYDLTADPDGHRKLAEVYRKAGLGHLEQHQLRKASAIEAANAEGRRSAGSAE